MALFTNIRLRSIMYDYSNSPLYGILTKYSHKFGAIVKSYFEALVSALRPKQWYEQLTLRLYFTKNLHKWR